MEKPRARHIYTVAEIARKEPERLAKALDLELDAAQKLKTGAEELSKNCTGAPSAASLCETT